MLTPETVEHDGSADFEGVELEIRDHQDDAATARRVLPGVQGVPAAPATSACRTDLAYATITAYARTLARELDCLLKLNTTKAEGLHLRDAIIVDARDKPLVFVHQRLPTIRDVPCAYHAGHRVSE